MNKHEFEPDIAGLEPHRCRRLDCGRRSAHDIHDARVGAVAAAANVPERPQVYSPPWLSSDGRLHVHISTLREALSDVLDSGDPERGNDPWELDARTEHGASGNVLFTITTEDATENRVRFVDEICGRLK